MYLFLEKVVTWLQGAQIPLPTRGLGVTAPCYNLFHLVTP
jgi:hypothetical protein